MPPYTASRTAAHCCAKIAARPLHSSRLGSPLYCLLASQRRSPLCSAELGPSRRFAPSCGSGHSAATSPRSRHKQSATSATTSPPPTSPLQLGSGPMPPRPGAPWPLPSALSGRSVEPQTPRAPCTQGANPWLQDHVEKKQNTRVLFEKG